MTARPLEIINAELRIALKLDTDNVISIGKLLTEAKDQLPHGAWIPWLRGFGIDPRTAQNYMAAHRVSLKYETVSHLKLRPAALYAMDEMTPAEVEKILKAAKRSGKYINREQALEITRDVRREHKKREAHEAHEILDGPPPALPPPPDEPPPKPRDAARFEMLIEAVATILKLQTVSVETLAEADISADDLSAVAALLNLIARPSVGSASMTVTSTANSSAFTDFTARQLRTAALRAEIIGNEIRAMAVALDANWITAEEALLELHAIGAGALIPTSSAKAA